MFKNRTRLILFINFILNIIKNKKKKNLIQNFCQYFENQ